MDPNLKLQPTETAVDEQAATVIEQPAARPLEESEMRVEPRRLKKIDAAPVRPREAVRHWLDDPTRVRRITLDELCKQHDLLSEWLNPTSQAVKISLYVAPPQDLGVRQVVQPGTEITYAKPVLVPATWCVVTIPPGAKVLIPTEFDGAIHDVRADKNGVQRVVGGGAPQLRKLREESGS